MKGRKAKREQETAWFRMVCESCGQEASPDRKTSTPNWLVFKVAPCKRCGGKVVPDVRIGDKHEE